MHDQVLSPDFLVSGFRVALVSMPFGPVSFQPSIQLGLLSAIARQAGFEADTHHLYLDLAARLTPAIYNTICERRGHGLGDWLFAVAAFDDQTPGDEDYFATFPQAAGWAERMGKDLAFLARLRHEVLPALIDEWLAATDWGKYAVIGFTSSYYQTVAALALARRIKERYPATRIVFGGANMEDEMGPEHARSFSFIDYVVVGEGDVVFPALLRGLAGGTVPSLLPGLVERRGERLSGGGQAATVRELDSLPTPDYSEYFERHRRLSLAGRDGDATVLPFESSRGCWWGQKHHCTFCGLNGLGMVFRAKSPQRVRAELAELSGLHQVARFSATDNILDMKYVKDLFGPLRAERLDYQFFYEVKANLTRAQVQDLYLGGVREIQPGIESLSSHVLQLMRKGSTMLQNVRLLKWCRYYGLSASWNLIWGFPGETAEDYRQELEVLKLLSHLEPPKGGCRIQLDRFSPYFSAPERFGIHDVRPAAHYRLTYPAHVNCASVAYTFDYEADDTLPEAAHEPTLTWLSEWTERWSSNRPGTLNYRRLADAVLVDDRRGPGPGRRHTLTGFWGAAYEMCSETMRSAAQVAEALQGEPFLIEAALDDFCRQGLMISEGGHYLSLALPVNPNW